MKGTTKILATITAAVFILAGCSGSGRGTRVAADTLNIDETQIANCDQVDPGTLIEDIEAAGTYCKNAEQIIAANAWVADIATKLKVCPDYSKVKNAAGTAKEKLAEQLIAVNALFVEAPGSTFLCKKINAELFTVGFKCSSLGIAIEDAKEIFASALAQYLKNNEAVLAIDGAFDLDAIYELILANLNAGTGNALSAVLAGYSIPINVVLCPATPGTGGGEIVVPPPR
jgi:hypothetical protein